MRTSDLQAGCPALSPASRRARSRERWRPVWPRRSGRADPPAPRGGAARPGRREPLVAEAGTGTGKSLAYLLPALLSGRRVVVATATKALQEQLLTKEVPAAAAAHARPAGARAP